MKVFIAERSQSVRASIIDLLSGQHDVSIVGSARSVSDSLSGVSRLKPDVVLLDDLICRNCSVDLPRLMKAGHPDLRVILLADRAGPQELQRRHDLSTSADHVLVKSIELRRLTEILRDVTALPS